METVAITMWNLGVGLFASVISVWLADVLSFRYSLQQVARDRGMTYHRRVVVSLLLAALALFVAFVFVSGILWALASIGITAPAATYQVNVLSGCFLFMVQLWLYDRRQEFLSRVFT